MNLMKPIEEDTKESLICDLAVNVLGVGTAYTIGDPTGMSAAVIQRVLKEVVHQVILPLTSRGESKRLYEWGTQAAGGIACRCKKGEEFRKDGFFDETPTNRSNFEEVVESMLKKVMDTTEEPKIKFMANLTVHAFFDEDLDMNTYRQIFKVLNELSYRQLCIIKMCKNADDIDVESLGSTETTTKLGSILGDFFELRDRGFIDPNSPLMRKLGELYVGSHGNTLVDAGRPPELLGFANQNGFFNFLSDTLFKFTDLDKNPEADAYVDEILQLLKK